MPNDYFSFKQFTVFHGKCAMKVGTDGVLIGAWTHIEAGQRVLDIGTGTGIIALMLAQRGAGEVMAVDIDEGAVEQAIDNVSSSKWADRIGVKRMDVSKKDEYEALRARFDVIVSNPPYFVEQVKCPDQGRHTARHTDALSFEALLDAASYMLTAEGEFSVVLPADTLSDFVTIAYRSGLKLKRQTWVHTKMGKHPKRILLAFGKGDIASSVTDHLYMLDKEGNTCEAYKMLVDEFYLDRQHR